MWSSCSTTASYTQKVGIPKGMYSDDMRKTETPWKQHCRILGLICPTSGLFQVWRTFQKEDEASLWLVDFKGQLIKSFMSWWWRQIWKWMHTEVWTLRFSQRVPTSPSSPIVSPVVSQEAARQKDNSVVPSCFWKFLSPYTCQQNIQVRATSALLGFPSCVGITDGMSSCFLLFLTLSCFYKNRSFSIRCKPLYTNSIVLMKDFTTSSWPKTSQRGRISHARSAKLITLLSHPCSLVNPHDAWVHELFQPDQVVFPWAVLKSQWIIWICLSEGKFWSLLSTVQHQFPLVTIASSEHFG